MRDSDHRLFVITTRSRVIAFNEGWRKQSALGDRQPDTEGGRQDK